MIHLLKKMDAPMFRTQHARAVDGWHNAAVAARHTGPWLDVATRIQIETRYRCAGQLPSFCSAPLIRGPYQCYYFIAKFGAVVNN
ncbi:hypothetical protein [Pararobbsia alpina]|uniref:hypothetical protein n=1 Tax=Pararobbsia alpina TaxID=621374 RepID=UPI001581D8D5|nr:hypothetical protein [Pararobbsia alpina]